jgi:hypothetical protein
MVLIRASGQYLDADSPINPQLLLRCRGPRDSSDIGQPKPMIGASVRQAAGAAAAGAAMGGRLTAASCHLLHDSHSFHVETLGSRHGC